MYATDLAPWAQRPLGEIIDHIVQTYHQPLLKELRRLDLVLDQMEPACPPLREAFAELREELEQHMQKEEHVLFPWFRSGRGASAGAPVRVMLHEHQTTKDRVRALRALVPGAPADGAGHAALAEDLTRLEEALLEHIRLEEEVLFPIGLGRE